MDFENLAKLINKVPQRWTTDDVARWLTFINLDHLRSVFREQSIDGSILEDIEPNDLEYELKIKSVNNRKKLMSWIKDGLREFTKFLQSSNKENIQQQKVDPMEVEYQVTPAAEKGVEMQQLKQLIVVPVEGTQSSKFCVSEEGGRIGRHSSNNLLVVEESVSRFHAEIRYDRKQESFELIDLGSSTGTYIKIAQKLQLKEGVRLQLGSFQFLVSKCLVNGEKGELELINLEGPSSTKEIKLSAKPEQSSWKIGRSSSNQLCFEDTHLSNIHARILYFSNMWLLEDMGSTNGSWQLLTKETPVQLRNNFIFKIGASSTFSCVYSDAKRPMSSSLGGNCVVCYQSQKDALFMPCKHNAACLRCSKMIRQCPICRVKIEEMIRIYK